MNSYQKYKHMKGKNEQRDTANANRARKIKRKANSNRKKAFKDRAKNPEAYKRFAARHNLDSK